MLLVFEGKRTEPNIVQNLSKYFINEPNHRIIIACYGSNIYKLYQELKKDDYLDLFELLKEQVESSDNGLDNSILEIESSEEVSDIYLFFDYDAHCGNASDSKLKAMLEYFDDSQDKGYLCISYPMVEAIKHISSDGYTYETHPVNDDLREYKKWVNQQIKNQILCQTSSNWGLYTIDTWRLIISINLLRTQKLTSQKINPISSSEIFDSQQAKHLKLPDKEIAVISSFLTMLHQFYGSKLNEKL